MEPTRLRLDNVMNYVTGRKEDEEHYVPRDDRLQRIEISLSGIEIGLNRPYFCRQSLLESVMEFDLKLRLILLRCVIPVVCLNYRKG